MKTTIRIGTRGSKLALWQAEWVRARLLAAWPSSMVELLIIKTTGDKILDVPLAKVGGKGLFVKEIEEALLDGRIDLAVHSMKDMPTDLPEGLMIGAVPERENPFDVLITPDGATLAQLPHGAVVGTSSLRRAAQLKHVRPDVRIQSLRGNLDTRIQKLRTENLDGIVLAAAGVKRLDYGRHISEYLPPDVMLPAVGQGALCIETRKADSDVMAAIAGLDHPETRTAVMGERAFLRRLEGGCQVPIAAFGRIEAGRLIMTGMVAGLNGEKMIRARETGPVESAERLGRDLAERLLDKGAGTLLEELKSMETGKPNER
ncbi:MAG: hydroxymethylbilane synthase [Thermodesulfobacteriota bacterium]